jgi:FlaA1/EpsC-like NDP-sugar epimerase
MNSFLVAQAPASAIRTLRTNPAAALQIFVARICSWAWRSQRSALVLGAELFLAAAAYGLAVFAFAETQAAGWASQVLWATLGVMIFFRLGGLASVRLYRRSLRHASVPDFISIVKAVAASSLLGCVAIARIFPSLKISGAVFVVDAAFAVLFWGGLHFGARVIQAQQAAWRKDGKRVVVVGAGEAGITLLKDLAQDPAGMSRAVAIIDDDAEKWGRTILGVPSTRRMKY